MKTIQRPFLFLILLGAASFLLPACGGQGNVKSKKAPETTLTADSTAPAEGSGEASSQGDSDSYVSSMKSKKNGSASTDASTAATTDEAPAQQPPTSSETPAMESSAPVKKGSNWLWWALGALVLVGAAFLAWKKRQSEGHASQPMPPVGGLSPVSGFTAVKDRIEEDPSEGTSIWSKKLF